MKRYFCKLMCIIVAAVSLAGCNDMIRVEPSHHEIKSFERRVRNAVTNAMESPRVANGSTLVIDACGDTLVAPADSALCAAPTRIIYVDIASPSYNGYVTEGTMVLNITITVVSVICGLILLVLLGVFITVWRRQSGRNRVITQAINGSYPLPESFYTGTPSQPTVNITQVSATEPSPSTQASSDNKDTDAPEDQQPGIDVKRIQDSLGNPIKQSNIKDIRNGAILCGLGLVLFLAFASAREASVGFFTGGTLLVLGLAKFLTIYYSRKF